MRALGAGECTEFGLLGRSPVGVEGGLPPPGRGEETPDLEELAMAGELASPTVSTTRMHVGFQAAATLRLRGRLAAQPRHGSDQH